MVTQELKFITYICHSQYVFVGLPFVIFILALMGNVTGVYSTLDILTYIGFWSLVFPTAAFLQQIGSLDQQELFFSYPLSPVKLAILYPFGIWILYGGLFEAVFYTCRSGLPMGTDISMVMLSLAVSLLFLVSLCTLLITLFKHAPLGLTLTLAYYTFGTFTTGTGQGPFYLNQWVRPKIGTLPEDFIGWQCAAIVLMIFLSILLLKYRNRFYLFHIQG